MAVELADDDKSSLTSIIYMCFILVLMFVTLASDKIGPDLVMIGSLTLCLLPTLITPTEALAGFSNQGLLTVLVLFVVASGISHTGGLDWYMSKLFGSPKRLSSAQLRLMLPLTFVSAFLNNTPVVAVMLPIVQRWSKSINQPVQQLLIPLSFASILGGTCTVIGTSTNLVVVGLLQVHFADLAENDPNIVMPKIGLFDVGLYGIPVALVGIGYCILASPLLLPGVQKQSKNASGAAAAKSLFDDDIMVSAYITAYSPSCNLTIGASNLRSIPGLYLVSLYSKATGLIHRAVGPDIVLGEGDKLEFTGDIEDFGRVCNEYGLEPVTNENDRVMSPVTHPWSLLCANTATASGKNIDIRDVEPFSLDGDNAYDLNDLTLKEATEIYKLGSTKSSLKTSTLKLKEKAVDALRERIRNNSAGRSTRVGSDDEEGEDDTTVSPLLTSASNRTPSAPTSAPVSPGHGLGGKRNGGKKRSNSVIESMLHSLDPPSIIVCPDSMSAKKNVVYVGINAPDRVGLLHDLSKGLSRLSLQLVNTEASVVGLRSLSLFRCEVTGGLRAERRKKLGISEEDVEEIWSVLSALLDTESGANAVKARGLRVIRCVVRPESNLIGKTAEEASFRKNFLAAIVAIKRGDGPVKEQLKRIVFQANDVLVLQVGDDSVLLSKEFAKESAKSQRNNNSTQNRMTATTSISSLEIFVPSPSKPVYLGGGGGGDETETSSDDDIATNMESNSSLPSLRRAVKDLVVLTALVHGNGEDDVVLDASENVERIVGREFLTAMYVIDKSTLIGKTVSGAGIQKLPGVYLVSIERPSKTDKEEDYQTPNQTISTDQKLQFNDVLWWSGSGSAIGDLRKIPGLAPMEDKQVKKIGGSKDRRLVQAVVARTGPLVGKTIQEMKFRTRFKCAVIAVHREGTRVQSKPGKITLMAGDVLLLEAGPSFIKENTDNARCFALLSEIDHSTPPRLHLLLPSLVIAAAMLAFYMAGVASLLETSLVASMLMVMSGILTQQEARNAINWDIYVTIAAAFGIGTAMVNSGVASGVANGLTKFGTSLGIGEAGLFGTVYLAAVLISNVVTNNAAAALLFPIAINAAEQSGIDVVKMSMCLMLGASASFMSPFGYQTNLMVYGPGGYKFKDFLVFGTPMQVLLWVWSVILLSCEEVRTVFLLWIVGLIFLVGCIVFRFAMKS